MIQIKITLFFCACLTIPLIGQTNKILKHPIDIKLEKCLSVDSNQTTSGMIQCSSIAENEWDKELNKYYKLLIDKLNSDEKQKLKNTQRYWLIYRDNELSFSGTMYYNMEGTMWRVTAAGRSCDLIKQRALELKNYYDMLIFDK